MLQGCSSRKLWWLAGAPANQGHKPQLLQIYKERWDGPNGLITVSKGNLTFTPYPLVSLFSIFKVKLCLLWTRAEQYLFKISQYLYKIRKLKIFFLILYPWSFPQKHLPYFLKISIRHLQLVICVPQCIFLPRIEISPEVPATF